MPDLVLSIIYIKEPDAQKRIEVEERTNSMRRIDVKKIFYSGMALIIFIFIFIWGMMPACAATPPSIRIDGQQRQFDPPCQIVDNRTMVPLRFVMEDPAFQGKLEWNAALRQVTLLFADKTFAFVIGNHRMMLDGQPYNIDCAPYLFEDRTYVPLRFLAENLGARVGWNESIQQVSIDFNTSSQVFAYYYYGGFDELKANADLFSDIAFRWFKTNSTGELSYEYKDKYQEILAFSRSKGIKTHASIVLMGKDPLHTLLSNPENRHRLIANIHKELTQSGYDGVNIDFELMAASDAGYLTLFMKELKSLIGPDKLVSIAVFARTAKDKWPTPYEYKALGTIADRVVVMAYDYHYATDSAGPVAPLWWVKDVVAYTSTVIPPEKLLLGMPTYGYDWVKGMDGTTVTAKKLNALKNRYSLTEKFDLSSMSLSYSYIDEQQVSHQIWMENERSLTEKWNVATENGLGGISFWRIGNGFDDLYKVLEKNL